MKLISFLMLWGYLFVHQAQAQKTLIPYHKKDKWGYSDASKNILIEPQYEEVEPFMQDSNLLAKQTVSYANVKVIHQWGVIDEQNKWIVPAKYPVPLSWDRRHGVFWAQSWDEGLGSMFYLISAQGKELLKLKGNFNWRGFDDNGIAYAAINDKVGFINREGKILIPFMYDMWSPVTEYCYNEGLFGVGKNGNFGFINAKNQVVIPFIYEHHPEGMACFQNGKTSVIKNGQKIVIDKKGQILEKPVYREQIDNFIEGYTLVIENTKSYPQQSYILLDKQTKKQALPEKFNYISLHEGVLVVMKNDKYGLINAKTLQYIHPISLTESPKSYQVAGESEWFWLLSKDGLWGVVSSGGQTLLPVAYDVIISGASFKKPAIALKNGKYVLVSAQNTILKTFDFLSISENYSTHPQTFYFKNKSDLQGVISNIGEEIIPAQYKRISSFGNLIFALKENKKQNVFDVKGAKFDLELDDYQYVGFSHAGEDHVEVAQNGKLGILDKKANLVIPCQYQAIENKADGIFYVKENNLWGIRNIEKLLIAPQYTEIKGDNIEINKQKFFWVKKGEKMGYVSMGGIEYFE